MPVHQSTLYIVLNVATKEQIAIGYLLTDNQTTMLCLSDKKINLALPFFATFIAKNEDSLILKITKQSNSIKKIVV